MMENSQRIEFLGRGYAIDYVKDRLASDLMEEELLRVASNNTELTKSMRARMIELTTNLRIMRHKESEIHTERPGVITTDNMNDGGIRKSLGLLTHYVDQKIYQIIGDAAKILALRNPAYLNSSKFDVVRFGQMSIELSILMKSQWRRWVRLISVVYQINQRLDTLLKIEQRATKQALSLPLRHCPSPVLSRSLPSPFLIPVPQGTRAMISEF